MTKIVYKVGDVLTLSRGDVTIVRVWPLGTVDVVDSDGRAFRVTGLRMYV